MSETVTVEIDVTAEDIKFGVPGSCTACPVAIAARRNFPGANVVVISRLTIDGRRSGPFSADVCRFIEQFDDGEAVEPIRFKVTLR